MMFPKTKNTGLERFEIGSCIFTLCKHLESLDLFKSVNG